MNVARLKAKHAKLLRKVRREAEIDLARYELEAEIAVAVFARNPFHMIAQERAAEAIFRLDGYKRAMGDIFHVLKIG